MAGHGRRVDPLTEHRRRLIAQIVVITALAAVALVLVVLALRTP